MNNDSQKIVWKKAKKRAQAQVQLPDNNEKVHDDVKNSLADIDFMDLAKRSAQHAKADSLSESVSLETEKESVSDLKSEIDSLLAGIPGTENGESTKEVQKDPVLISETNKVLDKQENTEKKNVSSEIDSLLGEIDKSLSSADTQKTVLTGDELSGNKGVATASESQSGSGATSAAMAAIEKRQSKTFEQKTPVSSTSPAPNEDLAEAKKEAKDKMENPLDSLKASIDEDLSDVETAKLLEEKEKTKGVGQTYFSDLSTAMGANEPATMSELIKRSRFEKKEKEILSPVSKKNILYIIGTIILLLGIGALIFFAFFNKKEEVQYITEKRVSSLVYADKDTGINTAGIESERTKQAIRKVIETDLGEDQIHQIYYVGKDNQGNLRRAGIKQMFDATENIPPLSLYEEIDNKDFMHGVYKTDKNHPFLILKTKSYDRAFKGMKEWEPTMIDDLSTYLDLPKEAGDRSLIDPGFADDLIKNKNVRVSRFLPREVDRRSGVFDIFRVEPKETELERATREAQEEQNNVNTVETNAAIGDNQPAELNENTAQNQVIEPEETQGQNDTSLVDTVSSLTHKTLAYLGDLARNTILNSAENSFAQLNIGNVKPSSGTTKRTKTVCYEKETFCIDNSTGLEKKVDNGHIKRKDSEGNYLETCYSVTRTDLGDKGGDKINNKDYICTEQIVTGDALEGNEGLGNEDLVGKQACFDRVTGNRKKDGEETSSDLCFDAYYCVDYTCTNGDKVTKTKEENQRVQSLPGYSCKEGVKPVKPEYSGQKVCRAYPALLTLQNVQNKQICFDQNGTYVEGFERDINGNYPAGVNCIEPINRDAFVCIDNAGKVVLKDPNLPESTYKFCFEPLDGSTKMLDEQFQQNYGELQQKAGAIALQLKALALLSDFIGIDGLADTLDEASDFFFQVALGNIQEDEVTNTAIGIVSKLDQYLMQIDPNNELSYESDGKTLTPIGKLRNIIDLIKGSFGFKHNVAWVTLGNRFPNGIPLPDGGVIYAGQAVSAVEPIQQTLVLIGLMDPVSVNGEFDLVTQDAIATFQLLNGLEQTGVIDTATLNLLNNIIQGEGAIYGGAQIAIVNDYLDDELSIGSYNEDVQSLQMILYNEGYNISDIDGLYDDEVCQAVRDFQFDNDLEISRDESCTLTNEAIDAINGIIKTNGFLGSGYALNANGFLQGQGAFLGKFGPGAVDFSVNQADADTLKEGDIVLMYTFLDEETILITRHESVITEIIRRRAFNDIFNKK